MAPELAPSGAPSAESAVAAPLSFLKGQLHTHSAGSYDAKEPPEALLRFYAERGYDFVAITDHNRVTLAPPPSAAPSVSPLLVIAGAELTQNAAICSGPAAAPGYRCLFHTGALFLEDVTPGQDLKLPFQQERGAAYAAQLAEAERLRGVGVVYHPHFHFAVNERLMARLAREGLRLFELSNAALDAQHPGGRAQAENRAENLWDAVLSQDLVLYGIATDDAHHFSEAEARRRAMKSAYTGDRGWVMVRAQRTAHALREALLAGDFYASNGVELAELERDKRHVSLRIRGSERSPAPFTTRFIGRGGQELAREVGDHATYQVKGGEGYVRAVVVDAAGFKAWTQPIMLP